MEPLPFLPAFPGLALGCLHQMVGDDAATGFCALVAGRLAERLDRPVLWVTAGGELYPPGLAGWGLEPRRLILARVDGRTGETDRLWAMEEGLRCPDLACVVGEAERLHLTAGRRLQLAAEAGGVTGLVLHPKGEGVANAGTTRWRAAAAPGGRWRLALERCRNGLPAEWMVETEATSLKRRPGEH